MISSAAAGRRRVYGKGNRRRRDGCRGIDSGSLRAEEEDGDENSKDGSGGESRSEGVVDEVDGRRAGSSKVRFGIAGHARVDGQGTQARGLAGAT